jgi:hypothetical protein
LDQRADVRAGSKAGAKAAKPKSAEPSSPAPPRVDERALKKELASTERKLDTLGAKVVSVRAELHAADPSDYVALQEIQARLHAAERALSDLEDVWVELSTRLAPEAE